MGGSIVMQLGGAVLSFFLLSIASSAAQLNQADQLPIIGGRRDVSVRAQFNASQWGSNSSGAYFQNKIQDTANNSDHINRHSSNISSLLWHKHIRHRRKNHNESVQQPIISNLNYHTMPLDSGEGPNLSNSYPEFVQQERPLLNATSRNSNDTHSLGGNFKDSTSPTNNNIAADQSLAATTNAPMIATTKSAATYNLSNSTDPYGFSAEAHSFALPIEAQIVMCILYGTLAFTAITSNMIVCYIVLSNQRMRTATNYFIVNLAVGDILMAILCIPFTFPANLVFQYWPFGLFLCVVVSYSQANSVFISAYTMVAISIDKYLAIMYPMRVRMTKTQSKTIILVIWSAAIITSLPTAILSRLSPGYVDLSTADMVPMDSQGQVATTTPLTVERHLQEQTTLNGTSPSTPMSLSDTTTHTEAESSRKQEEEPFPWQNKYFCQESWSFWPKGKYYYSMALMILQFVLPLFVLVITYSWIVVVVWGKKIPGEEDNARDARMARSKRKMIKMVILCVIAFALTWLPFNALIVIGDMRPDIWEHQSIMYIWFVTHYLAMCHTITNPLIYIWMNNRFRAGFRQVISDLCKPIVHLFCYVWFHFCCLGCIFDCSRGRYLRGHLRREQKRGSRDRPAGANMGANNQNYNPSGHNQTGFATSTNNNNSKTTSNNNNNNKADGPKKSRANRGLDNNNGTSNNDTTTNNNNNCSTHDGGGGTRTQTTSAGGTISRYSRTRPAGASVSASAGQDCETSFGGPIVAPILAVCSEQPLPGCSSGGVGSAAGQLKAEQAQPARGVELGRRRAGANFDGNTPRDCEIHNGPLGRASGGRRDFSMAAAASLRHRLAQFFLWRRKGMENGPESNDATISNASDMATTTARLAAIDGRISSSTLLMSGNCRGAPESHKERNYHNSSNSNNNDSKELRRKRKQRKRDKQSHVISIRMTAVDYYRKPTSAGPSSGPHQPMALLGAQTHTRTQGGDHVSVGAAGQPQASFLKCKPTKESACKQSSSSCNRLQPEDVAGKGLQPDETTTRMSIGRLMSAGGRHRHKKKCPVCRDELATATLEAAKRGARGNFVAALREKLAAQSEQAAKFVIDLHQSSQSTTPTISTNQTNITSLILSPVNSSTMSRDLALATTINGPATTTNECANSPSTGPKSRPQPAAMSPPATTPAALAALSSVAGNNEDSRPASCRLVANSGLRVGCASKTAQNEIGPLSNVRINSLTTRHSQQKRHHCSETHLLDGKGQIRRESPARLLGSLDQLQQYGRFAPGRALKSMVVPGSPPNTSGPRATNFGQVRAKHTSETALFGRATAAALDSNYSSSKVSDVDLESGGSSLRQENNEVAAGDDHYCAWHQRNQLTGAQPRGLIDDHYGTDEDVCDELLSSHRQQASRNEADCGSLELLSDRSAGDFVDSEAELLVEYGDLEGQGNALRLVRLNNGNPRSSNGTGNSHKPARHSGNHAYDSNTSNNSTTSDNYEATRRLRHLSALFRSAGDNLYDEQTNGRHRLATRRARYRKLQSVANMVATTRIETPANKVPKRAGALAKGGQIDGIRQERSHELDGASHRRQSGRQIDSSSDALGLLMLANQAAAATVATEAARMDGNIRRAREHNPDWLAELQPLNINQAADIDNGVGHQGGGHRLISIGNKFATKSKRPTANAVGASEYQRRLNQMNCQVVQQQLLVSVSPTNGRLAHQRPASCKDVDDKTDGALIYGSQSKDSLGGDLRDGAHKEGSDEDESTVDRSSSSSPLTNSNPQLDECRAGAFGGRTWGSQLGL